jgi:integrase
MLTNEKVAAALRAKLTKPVKISDGSVRGDGSLLLLVRPMKDGSNRGYWVYQHLDPTTPSGRNAAGLGLACVKPEPGKLTLAQAREARDAKRNEVKRRNAEPGAPVRSVGAAAAMVEEMVDAGARRFKDAVEGIRGPDGKTIILDSYFDRHGTKWTPAERSRRERMMREMPFYNRPFHLITKREVAEAILDLHIKSGPRKGDKLWVNNSTAPGSLYRYTIECILGYAADNSEGFDSYVNVATWNALSNTLPNPKREKIDMKVVHHADRALHRRDAPAFYREIQDPIARLLLLTGVRRIDVLGDPKQGDKPPMCWEHITDGVWTIPSTKTDKEHRLPLTQAMMDCMGKPGRGPVFSERSEAGYRHVLEKIMSARRITLHGLRGTIRAWVEKERMDIPLPVKEAILAHGVKKIVRTGLHPVPKTPS